MEEQTKTVQVFNFQGNNFRVVVVDGDPWFVINDVCKVLELGNVSRVIDRLDSDGVTQSKVTDSSGRMQDMAIANEPNLYRLIFRSDKPEAKAFQDEVYNKVLPSIRKTGSYGIPTIDLDTLDRTIAKLKELKRLASPKKPRLPRVSQGPRLHTQEEIDATIFKIIDMHGEATGREIQIYSHWIKGHEARKRMAKLAEQGELAEDWNGRTHRYMRTQMAS